MKKKKIVNAANGHTICITVFLTLVTKKLTNIYLFFDKRKELAKIQFILHKINSLFQKHQPFL